MTHASLKSAIISITGAASGIGRASANLLAENGAHLIIGDIDEKGLAAVENELQLHEQGSKIWSKRVDVTDPAQVRGWLDEGVKHFKQPLDGAANLAGIAGRMGTLREYSPENYDRVFAVNVKGVMNSMAAELGHLRRRTLSRPGGSIVNAASLCGLVGRPMTGVYCASKFAVVGITKAAATDESESGIRINAIAPGMVDTPMMQGVDSALGYELPHDSVLGRRARPEEIAKLILFLLSDGSSYTTGSVYSCDGGMQC